MILNQWRKTNGHLKYSRMEQLSILLILEQEVVHIEIEKVMDFYQNVIWLYRLWTEIEECRVCDGCSYELTITYKDNRKKKLTGDLGGGTVDKTVTDFLCTIPEFRDKLDGSENE